MKLMFFFVFFVSKILCNFSDDSNDAPLEVSYVSQKNKSRQDLNVTQHNEAGTEAVEANSSAKKKNKKNKKGLNSSQNVTDISIIDNEGLFISTILFLT